MKPPPPPVPAVRPVDTYAAERRAASIRQLRGAGDVVQVLGFLIIAVGILGGAALALQTEDNGFGPDTRPYVAEGISAGVSGLVTGALIALFGYWAVAWANVNEGR